MGNSNASWDETIESAAKMGVAAGVVSYCVTRGELKAVDDHYQGQSNTNNECQVYDDGKDDG